MVRPTGRDQTEFEANGDINDSPFATFYLTAEREPAAARSMVCMDSAAAVEAAPRRRQQHAGDVVLAQRDQEVGESDVGGHAALDRVLVVRISLDQLIPKVGGVGRGLGQLVFEFGLLPTASLT